VFMNKVTIADPEITKAKELSNPQEVISHLTHAAVKKVEAHIWKRNIEGQVWLNEKVRILKVVNAIHIKIEFENETELSPGEEVFFALEGGTLVFKSYVVESLGRRLLLALPTIAKGIERRRSHRRKFKFEERIDFEFEYNFREINNRSTAFLLDVSQHGICLSLSDETVREIELNQVINLVRTNAGVTPAKCIVRSIRIFRAATIGRGTLYAVGLEFAQ
jgi:hypothetical protein